MQHLAAVTVTATKIFLILRVIRAGKGFGRQLLRDAHVWSIVIRRAVSILGLIQ